MVVNLFNKSTRLTVGYTDNNNLSVPRIMIITKQATIISLLLCKHSYKVIYKVTVKHND